MTPALFSCIKTQDQAFPAPPDLTTTQTEFVDSFSVYQETYRFDSLNTTSRLRLFAGGYDDPILGKTEAKSYFQILPSSYTPVFPDTFIRIDSALMMFRYDSKYGKPGTDQFMIHKLTQPMDGDKSYFNFSPDLPYSADTVFSTRGQKTIGRFTYINAKSLAEEIFQKWKAAKQFSNDQQFLTQFPGFALVSLGYAQQITSFPMQDSVGFPPTLMRIFFRYLDKGDTLRGQYDLKVDASTVHFATIRTNFDGTPWAAMQPKAGLSASVTNGKSAVQGVTALVSRLKLPGLLSWKNGQTRRIKVFKAELEIKPDAPGLYEPPTYIRIGRNEDYNIINESPQNIVYNDEQIFYLLQSQFTTAGAKNQIASQIFPYNATLGTYKCNITSYVQSVIDGTNTSTSLNIYPHFWTSSFNRMLISQGNVRMKVFYYPLP